MISSKATVAIWSAILQWSRVGINALVFLALSRWLTLSELGAVAAVQAPVIALQSLVTVMFPDLVVQERLPSQRRLSTIFWVSGGVGVILVAGLLAFAPFISRGIDDPNAQLYLYALVFCPFAWSISSVFEGLLRRRLETKLLARRTAISSGIAAVAALYFGYSGFGGWAIVAFSVANALTSTTITIASCNWRPSCELSTGYARRASRRILSLAGRHTLTAITWPAIQYAVTLQLGSAAGGIFQIAARIYMLVDAVALMPYRFIVLPLFSKGRAKFITPQRVYEAISMGSLIAAPAYIGVTAIAPTLMPLLLGEQNGTPSIVATQLLCMSGAIASLGSVLDQILTARGYAGAAFRRSMALYSTAIAAAILATYTSVEAVAGSYTFIAAPTGLLLAVLVSTHYLEIEAARAVIAWLKPVLAGFTLLLLLFVPRLFNNDWLNLVSLISLGALLFAGSILVFARAELRQVLKLIRTR